MSGAAQSCEVVVLGIGNLLWADEGFGVRCVEALQQRYVWPARVSLVDGGTQGLYLMEHVQRAEQLLIFDAVDYAAAPGTLLVVRDSDVPRFMGVNKLSLHQTGFQEVLALAELLGAHPRAISLVGCQPHTLDDYGGSLTPSVRAALEPALRLGMQELARWQVAPELRKEPDAGGAALGLQRYEAERPGAQLAERRGDPRFMPRTESG